MSQLPCEICGCTDFTKQSGFYICNNCDTQSQNIQEQSFNFEDSQIYVNEDTEIILQKSQEVVERKLTSWECYNILLKGFVDELIDLGASSKLKVVTFQLWSFYLKRANIAFTSKTEETFPLLSVGFKNKDVNALYGISNLRNKLFKNFLASKKTKIESKSETSSTGSLLSRSANYSLRKQQRKMALTRNSNPDESYVSENKTVLSIEKIMNLKSRKRKRIAFNSSSRKSLKEMLNLVQQTQEITDDEKILKKFKSKILFKTFNAKRSSKCNDNIPVNTLTLISIVRIALLYIGDQVYLGDILRWICEGRLSVNQPEKFVPKFYEYVKKNDLLQCNRNGFQLDIKTMTKFLNLSDIPTPDLYKLFQRYCLDLHLPNEFIETGLKIMAFSKLKMNYHNYQFRIFPDYECRVMAFILYTFKLLFSLDDYTEFHQSEFAEIVNKLAEQRNIQNVPKLFEWTTWVQYIECRNAVLSKYDVTINQLIYDDRINNREVFFSYWNKLKPLYESNNKVIKPAFLSSLRSYFQSFLQTKIENQEFDRINFPTSLTPFKTNISYFLTHHSQFLPQKAQEILSQDFDSYSVKYVLDTECCTHLAEQFELKTEFTCGDEVNLIKYKKPEEIVPVLSRTTIPSPYVPTSVQIEEDEEKFQVNRKNSTVKCKTFYPEVNVFNTKSNRFVSKKKNCSKDGFKIFKPYSRYWFFHEFHRRISVEEFNSLIEENLSKSFLWLLKQCAVMLRVDLKELYLELVQVESVLCKEYFNENYSKQIPLKVYPNEW